MEIAKKKKLTQAAATMATVPPQVHRASCVTLPLYGISAETTKLDAGLEPCIMHGLPGHGLTLRNGKDAPLAMNMRGPLVVGREDVVFLQIPHLSLYDFNDFLVKTHGRKKVLSCPERIFMAPPLGQRYWPFSHTGTQLFHHRELACDN